MKKIINLDYTISKNIFKDVNNLWEVIPKIKSYILELGESLDKNNYTKIKDNVWVGSNVSISNSATIIGPCIIDDNAEIRPNAYIRGNVIIGKNSVIGNSTEVKNSIIFDNVQIPHFNYVGDSILGYKAHMGAGSITSNIKSDRKPINIKDEDECIETGMKKIGAILGDNVEIGCNTVLCPGTIVGRDSIVYPSSMGIVYPSSMVRGVIGENKIYKAKDNIVERK